MTPKIKYEPICTDEMGCSEISFFVLRMSTGLFLHTNYLSFHLLALSSDFDAFSPSLLPFSLTLYSSQRGNKFN